MAWTKEKPTEPGCYWWRWMEGENGYRRIVLVSKGSLPESPLRVTYIGSEKIEALDQLRGEFWDEPILPPEGGLFRVQVG